MPPLDEEFEAYLQTALEAWPQIDPQVEGISSRINRADRYLETATRALLSKVGLTKEEFKVLTALHSGARSHGSLCREFLVSTGAMTNRLDKLERAGLVARGRDPLDRRGVLLELTSLGQEKLAECVDIGASREKQLLAGLSDAEKRQLNRLLQKLLGILHAELA
jgi:DNA-binding MarR family transcriptional regulator